MLTTVVVQGFASRRQTSITPATSPQLKSKHAYTSHSTVHEHFICPSRINRTNPIYRAGLFRRHCSSWAPLLLRRPLVNLLPDVALLARLVCGAVVDADVGRVRAACDGCVARCAAFLVSWCVVGAEAMGCVFIMSWSAKSISLYRKCEGGERTLGLLLQVLVAGALATGSLGVRHVVRTC